MKNLKNRLQVFLCLAIGLMSFFASSCKKDDINTNTFTDSRDGTVYKTVKIGDQLWMAENLKYLPFVSKPLSNSATIPLYYVYDYDGTDENIAKNTFNYKTYGVLYNWPAACESCPLGWHLPTDAEWEQLTGFLGGTIVASLKLKEAGTTHWAEPNTGATNESGFTARPGGYARTNEGEFKTLSYFGYWWSATEYNSLNARCGFTGSGNTPFFLVNYEKMNGYSVRCVKD